ncbi:fungal-specific transcription factor domain-containing protein [Rhodocollybia butyracea]|uniref:Fungal-specific transcription factor domain-containing protein n=1 Tax=Rhodocollybia butyracea TaxID=206335 RepID=A0A9P5PVN7_9AGAR|nr:fungal-specific transcription factor domain-containing protein [Rhodocollybia butyracea]
MSDSRVCSRPIQSCYQCRKRKIKCNRAYPCAPCLLRGEGDVCREVDRSHSNTNKSTVETLDDVLHRLVVLERAVSRLSTSLPSDLVSSGSGEIESPSSTSSSSSLRKSQPKDAPRPLDSMLIGNAPDGKPKSSIRSSYGSGSTDEDVAMMLEDFAMGHRVNRSRAARNLEDEAPSAYSYSGYGSQQAGPIASHEVYERTVHSITTPISAVEGFAPQLGLPDSHPLSLLIDPSTNVISRLVSALPNQNHRATLVHFYFERLEWYSKVLHAPSFLSEASQLSEQVFFVMNTEYNSPVQAQNQVSIPFLSVYFMVLCLSFHLIEPDICQKLSIGFAEAIELSKKMYNAAQACFYVSDFIGNHSLEALQCLILMGIYQQNLDEADAHWALLGSAIKMAQNLGISRLGSESDNRSYSGMWSSVVKREIARRIWWSLIFNDWSHAAAHNGTYSIHPSQNHTGFPANIDDIDLVEGMTLQERPNTQYTEMTLSLTRFRFVEVYREIVDNMQSPTGYEFVAEMDAKLRQIQEEIPRYFEEGDTTATAPYHVKRLELTLCLLMGETRQLRLHRPFLFKGYKDRKYAKSRERCIHSAREILNLLKSNNEQSAILLKWWMVLFYGFAASVVLFIDLCHHKVDNGPDLDFRRAELREALDLFKTVEHISSVSQNAIALLEGLLRVEPDILAKPSKKRGASSQETDESFGQVVKRMIVDAHRTGMSSPTSQSSGSLDPPLNRQSLPLSPTGLNAASFHHHCSSAVAGLYPSRIPVPVDHSAGPSMSSQWTSTQYSTQHTMSPNGLPLTLSEYDLGQDGFGLGLGWGLPGRDVLAPNILFREAEMFEASMRELDEVTMDELGQLLWSDDGSGLEANGRWHDSQIGI